MLPTDVSTAGTPSFKPHWDLYPRTYIAHKTSFPLIDHMDGDLNKDVWSDVPWSEYFDDIRGEADAPDDYRPKCGELTRFKAIWDDTHLYIGAILHSDFETQAHFTERNSPIYQKDSDFEVFVDPLGTCHYYKELEVNAINTVWNLMLDRPYADGGIEHSGRIAKPGDAEYYEVFNQKTATCVIEGKLNDPDEGATWSIEIALSYSDLMAHVSGVAPPTVGSLWRINFSRVERNGDINWTWAPQIVWNPKEKRFSGFVDMHRPDAWGYVVFGGATSDESNDTATSFESVLPRDTSWPARLAAMNVYYAQKSFHEKHGMYASKIEDLLELLDSAIISPFQIQITVGKDSFLVSVTGNFDGTIITVTEDRYLRVKPVVTKETL